MESTTRFDPNLTLTPEGVQRPKGGVDLVRWYDQLVRSKKVSWTGHHHMLKLLGRGGQGEVYLTEFRGTDGFTVPVAMKIFSPEHYATERAYEEAMKRVGKIAARVALIQHDNLLAVQNFFERHRIRIMMMEWVDGYDLRKLITPRCLNLLQRHLDNKRFRYINDVIITRGAEFSRFKAGVAVAIIRDVLAALAALHREGIVHGDIKPANIMLKRTGHSKLIDMGSAIEFENPPLERECTPMYAAPEVLQNQRATPRSDLASAGYVLIELMSGRNIFAETESLVDLIQAKYELPDRLAELLPDEISRNELLMKFIRGLIAPDPNLRFPNADAAEHVDTGAAAFHRQLVIGKLSTEYVNDIRLWLEELRRFEVDL
ncbi:serine/threonine-protein kinase [Planctomycetes bacterium SV_7m_r]